MANAAQKASKGLLRDFSEVEQLQVSVKGPSDFVSQADLRAERTLMEELSKVRPGYAFLMEESGASGSPNWAWRWVVDPLDGTTNFLHGIPHFAVSIALERNGAIVAALTYNPANDELFVAERGKGAFLNNQRM
ncbi:MAG: inositol monophosphatase family protein, partial [Acetobacteraceae bacterium]